MRHPNQRHDDPTEEEILAMCRAIQSGWSDEERDYRVRYCPGLPTPRRKGYAVPTISIGAMGSHCEHPND